jgi:DNA-binding MarR family transcriptional regulator
MTLPEERERCVCSALRQASRQVTRLYDEALAGSGLRITSYSVLATLDRMDAPLVSELAEAQAMDRTTLTRALSPLLAQGLARLRVGSDRRRRHVELTARGRRALVRAYPAWCAAQAEFAARARSIRRAGGGGRSQPAVARGPARAAGSGPA